MTRFCIFNSVQKTALGVSNVKLKYQTVDDISINVLVLYVSDNQTMLIVATVSSQWSGTNFYFSSTVL